MKGAVKVLLGIGAAVVIYGIYDGFANEDEYQMRALVNDAGGYTECVKTEGLEGFDWLACRYKEDVDVGPVWIRAGEQGGKPRYVAANGPALSVVDAYESLDPETKAKRPVVVKHDADVDAHAPAMVPWDKLN